MQRDIRAGQPSDRLEELDALRGLAAFAVLVHHALQLIPRYETPAIAGAGWLRYTMTQLTPLRIVEMGRPAVLFFFVLSGYVLVRALLRNGSPGLGAFAAQRTIRLGLPVAVSVLLSVVLYAAFAEPALPAEWRERSLFTWLEPPTAGQIVSNIALMADNDDMRLNVVLWSLVHEWRMSLLLPLVLLFRGRVALFIAAVLALMAIGIMGGATENRVLLGPQLHSTVAASFYFAGGIGTGAALALALGQDVPRLSPQAMIAAGMATLALFSMSSDLPVYAASALLIVIARQPGWLRDALRSPVLVGLGAISFSLYLVHVPVLVATMHALHDEWPPEAMAAFATLLALAAALPMYRFVEVPSRRLARRVEKRLGRRSFAAPVPRCPAPAPDWAPEGGMPSRVA
ncbi:acyltransferase family protein [Falsiroseomonas sp.]|jgi:peptidoglycan/LPS O-acetylase OafA/YrhL|uniref:acyltransferase family protein n=1 Tax=Falsiroseomonas sp. TaxID=2870721 RepID=UPI003F718158